MSFNCCRAALRGSLAVLFAAVGLAALPLVARAQTYGTARILRPRQQTSGEFRPNFVSLTPLLYVGIDNRAERTASAGAGVLGYERALNLRSTRTAAQLGAFAYTQGDKAFYQLQSKVYFGPSVGFQANLISKNFRDTTDVAVYALYNLSTRTFDKAARVPWDFQIGLGAYLPGGDKFETGQDSFSGYTQLGFNVTSQFSVTGSYLGIATGDRSSINRVGLTFGYNF